MEIKNNLSLILRLLIMFFLLFILYQAGLPFEILIIFTILYFCLIFFRNNIKDFINSLLHKTIPGFEKHHPWVKTIVVFIFFILVYVILKQIVYLAFSFFGIDIESMILKSFVGSLK